MKNKALVILTIGVIFLGIFFYFHRASLKEIKIRGNKFKTELAVSPPERERGLSERKNLCKECGMLFIFEKPGEYSFWMKNMRFPLDIVWILDNKVVYIANNIPFDFKESIRPSFLADKVLEINGGMAEKYGLKTGDEVEF